MKEYELTVIYNTDDAVYKSAREKVTSILKNANVSIEKEDDLGIRDLAYDIKKESKGHYVFSNIKSDPAGIIGIEKQLRIESGLLKFLFIKSND